MQIRNAIVRSVAAVLAAAALSGCRGDSAPTTPAPPPVVLLKEVEVSRLPSPYYHFDYDATPRVRALSFASGFLAYDVTYTGDRIAAMTSTIPGNHETLEYLYDDAGRVSTVKYLDSSGRVYTVLFLSYTAGKLVGIERDRRVDAGFIIDKTTTLSYYPDGNLRELIVHRPAIAGRQDETTTVDRFERYDDKLNVDGFDLVHDEFMDHVVLLPGVQLQKGNAARVVRTGDGVNFTVDYTYVYDAKNRPLTKSGDLLIQNGADAGRRIQTSAQFSYY